MSAKMKRFMLVMVSVLILTVAFAVNSFAARDAVGDLNRDGVKDEKDAIHLLNHYIFGEEIGNMYNVDQPCDYNGDGVVDEEDAIYLLNNILFGNEVDSFHICDHPENWDVVKTVPATCKEGGYTVVKCLCGKEANILPTEKTDEHSFDWDNADLSNQATCLENGYITATCTVCGETETHQQKAAGEHTWVNGSCETGASCEFCDATLPAEGHKYPDTPTFVMAATCKGGYNEYKCENCDSVHRVDLAPTDHRFADNAWHTVSSKTTDTNCIYVYVEEAECLDCGETISRTTGEVEKHTETTTVVPATCVKAGEKTISCSVCKKTLSTTIMPVPANESAKAHSFDEGVTEGSVTTFTCQNDGCGATKTTVKASEDGKVDIGAAEEVELENGAAIIPDENIKNELGGKDVSVSIGEVKADDLEKLTEEDKALLKELGDAPIFDLNLMADGEKVTSFGEDNKMTVRLPYTLAKGDDPDCIIIWYIGDDGHIDHFEAKYVDGYAVFETNHFSYYTVTRMTPAQRCEYYGTHNNQITEVPATCVTGGYTLSICTRCGHKETSNDVAALGHNWDSKTTAPTCVKNGKTVYTCRACDITYTEISKAIGHNIVEVSDKYKAPTCTAKGEKLYACDHKGCTFSYKEEIAQLAHDYAISVIVPDCENGGYTLHTCNNCEHYYTSEAVKALGHDYIDGVCSNCEHACEHVYEYGVCVNCNMEKPEEPKPETPVEPEPEPDPEPDEPKPEEHEHKLVYSYEFLTAMKRCEYGVAITEACSECDYTNTYTTYDCVVWVVDVDLSAYESCGKHNFSYYNCPCGRQIDWVGDVYLEEPLGENYNGFGCSECAMKALVSYAEEKDGCVIVAHQSIDFYCGDELIHSMNVSYYEYDHEFGEIEFEFIDGNNCETGVTFKATCTKCNAEISQTTYDHEIISSEEILAGECDKHIIRRIHCACGEVNRISTSGFNYLPSIYPDSYDIECGSCGVRVNVRTVLGEKDDKCQIAQIITYTIYNGKEVVNSFDVASTTTRHNYVGEFNMLGETCNDGVEATYVCEDCGYSYSSIEYNHTDSEELLDLSEYGVCAHHEITVNKCGVCGEIISAWYNDMNGQKTENGWHMYCEECPVQIFEIAVYGEIDENCWMDTTFYCTLMCGDEVLLEYVMYGRTQSHTEETWYELLGSTCDDGYIVHNTCTRCGRERSYEGYGHEYRNISVDLTQYGGCAYHKLRFTECGICGNINRLTHGGFATENTENGEHWYCMECDTHVYKTVFGGEKGENCTITSEVSYVVTVGGTDIFNRTVTQTRTEHNNETVYELMEGSTSCKEGVYVFETCKDCGTTSKGTLYGHRYIEVNIDLSQYKVCDEHCVVGSVCDICGEGELWLEGGKVYSQSIEGGWRYYCKKCNFELIITEIPGEKGENCSVEVTKEYVLIVDGNDIFTTTIKSVRYEHDLDTRYKFMEGSNSCEDGVYVYSTCKSCGLEDNYTTYGHQYQEGNFDLSKYGVCAEHYIDGSVCSICGKGGYINLKGGELYHQKIDDIGSSRRYCPNCSIEMYSNVIDGEKDENCNISLIWIYSLRVDGKEILVGQTTGGRTEHNYEFSCKFYDEKLGCDGGVYVSRTCKDCGESETLGEYYHHETMISTEYRLAEHGHKCENGVIYMNTCPCGAENSMGFDLPNFSSSGKGENIDGVQYEITTWTCESCGYVITQSSYTIRDAFCNAIRYTDYTFGDVSISIQFNVGKEHVTTEKELKDESYTVKNEDGTTLKVSAFEHYCENCKASLYKFVQYYTYDVNGNVTKFVEEQYRYEMADGDTTVSILEGKSEEEYLVITMANGKDKYAVTLYHYNYYYDNEGNVHYWEKRDYVYEGTNYCAYTVICTTSNGESWTERNKGNHVQTASKFVLSEGSTSCLEGVDGVWYCTVCGTETRRNNYGASKSHRFNKELAPAQVIDFQQYGATCEGKLNIFNCACGAQISTSVESKCDFDYYFDKGIVDEKGVEHRYELYTCAVSNCGFKYALDQAYMFDDACNETCVYSFYFGIDETNENYNGTYSYSYMTGTKRHADSQTNTTVTNTRYYSYTYCSKCGMIENEVEIENGVRTETNYEYRSDGTLSIKHISKYLAINNNRYGYQLLSRSEQYDSNGKYTYWSQNERVYPNAASGNYCTVVRTYTDMNGNVEIYTEENHSWTHEGNACVPTLTEMQCTYCGTIEIDWLYFGGHSFSYDGKTGMFICNTCGLLSYTDGNGEVIFEDKTAKLGDGTNYVIGWQNSYSGDYVWSLALVNDKTGAFVFLDDIAPYTINNYTMGLDAVAIREAAKANGFGDCDYMIRLAFVPVDGKGELDYAITLDPHVYEETGRAVPKDGCESGYAYSWTYSCKFCGDTYTEEQKGHYYITYVGGDNGRTVLVGDDGTITVTNVGMSICKLCGKLGGNTYTYVFGPNGQTIKEMSESIGSGYSSEVTFEYDYENNLRIEICVEDGYIRTNKYDMTTGRHVYDKTEHANGESQEYSYIYVDGRQYTSATKYVYSDGWWEDSTYTYDFENDLRKINRVYSSGARQEVHNRISDGVQVYRRREEADGSWSESSQVYNEADGTYTETTKNSNGYERITVKLIDGKQEYAISEYTREADGSTSEYYYEMVNGDHRPVKYRYEDAYGYWTQTLYTYDDVNDLRILTQTNSNGETRVDKIKNSTNETIYHREDRADGSWYQRDFVYDYANDTRTETSTYSTGEATIYVYSISNYRQIYTKNIHADGTFSETRYIFDDANDTQTSIRTNEAGDVTTEVHRISDYRELSYEYVSADKTWFSKTVYTYDDVNGTRTVVSTNSDGTIFTDVQTWPDCVTITSRTEYADGRFSESRYIIDEANDTRTGIHTNEVGDITTEIFTISDGRTLSREYVSADKTSFSKTVYTYDDANGTRTVVTTDSNGRTETEVQTWPNCVTITSRTEYADGSYHYHSYAYHGDGIYYLCREEYSNLYGYSFVREYIYYNNDIRLTNAVYTHEDGSQTIDSASYDFDNDICTLTRTENGETTVIRTYISTGMPVE